MKNKQIDIVIRLISFVCIAIFIWMTVQHFNAQLLLNLMHKLVSQPGHASYMFMMYGLAFVLRAMAWKWYLPQARFQTCVDGLFASLFINHIFPIKVGDVARIGICARRDRIPFTIVAESVIILRLLDLIVLFFFAFFGAIVYMHTVIRSAMIFPLIFGGLVVLFFVLRRIDLSWLQKHKQHWNMIWKSRRFVPIVVAIVFSWICEAVVLFEMAKMVAFPLSFAQSLWVNSMTVGGQIFQMTPGGLATYEAVMAFALTRIHPYWEQAYALALVTHLFKFSFSYVVGLYVWFRTPTLWTFVRKEGVNS
ncbi:lysylphosphatidylglycerol synthase transmembrane domain-containing protein [Anoxybacillus sp. MB8]|uniref:lysylphosphatidylglycerol synthase transmembrane domain-containing protein n=1 Tax=Anoxybacillus sp. MB8 TaxID=2496850 RepID=UPI0013D1EB15|nr:lysylphosphatidylglycerol synthase transmembrane domain-containing protein [Anoxybacillus sp. MB8]